MSHNRTSISRVQQRKRKPSVIGQGHKNRAEKQQRLQPQHSLIEVAITAVKPLFEEMRQKATTKARKQELIDQVLRNLEPQLVCCARRHDAARVLETALKYGSREQRKQIWEALAPEPAKLTETRYGQHVIRALFLYGTGVQRRALLASLQETLARMATTQDGAALVDHVYQTVANRQERRVLLLLTLVQRDRGLVKMLAKQLAQLADSDDNAFDGLFEALEQPFHQRLVECCRQRLEHVYDKPRALSTALIHDLLWTMLSSARLGPQEKHEIGRELASRALYLYHTNHGSMALILLIQSSDAKWRKECARGLREILPEVWNSKYGHRVVLALFAWTDDTVMLSKTLIRPLLPKLGEMLRAASSDTATALTYVHVPLLFLLAGETTRYFHPTLYDCVCKPRTASIPVIAPKKESAARRQELLEQISSDLYALMLEHGARLLCDYKTSPRLGALFIELCRYWHRQAQPEWVSEVLSRAMNEIPWNALEGHALRQRNETLHHLNVLGKLLPDMLASTMPELQPRLIQIATDHERAQRLYAFVQECESAHAN
jgi:pumilio family protein 6